jgi:hypothetical protein
MTGERRVHPVDLLALLLAVGAAVGGYAFLFRRQPVPRPADPLLGAVIDAEFPADRAWKREFGRPGERLLLDDLLTVEILEAGPGALEGSRRLRLRVAGRDAQESWAVANLRWGIHRGSSVALRDEGGAGGIVSTVTAEVVAVAPPKGP